MKIIIFAANSHLGKALTTHLGKNHDLTLVTRRPYLSDWPNILWNGKDQGLWTQTLEGADVVINLAGRTVNCRYNKTNRKQILDSRVQSTAAIGQAIGSSKNPPQTWLQMSTATIYSNRFDHPNDESTGLISDQPSEREDEGPAEWKFSVHVAKSWEQSAQSSLLRASLPESRKTESPFLTNATPGTRLVLLRSAMVMTPVAQGVFDTLLRLVRFGLGGRQGSGKQYVSWIHEIDFIRSIQWLIDNPGLSGAVNICSPNPLPNVQFMQTLRTAWGAKFGLNAATWMLHIGTFLMRTEPELVLKSRCVVPSRLLDSGFEFSYPDWNSAAHELCERWRQLN